MNNISEGIQWFKLKIESSLGVDFEFKYINEKNGDFGDLSGVQFDSEKMGGYIYFWSSGVVGYQLYDYFKDEEIVKDSTEDVRGRAYDDIFSVLINELGIK